MTVKKLIGKVHLWLGLTSGIIVVIIAVTGCLLAFEREIGDLTQPYKFVQAQNAAYLAPSRIMQIAVRELPGKHPHSVQYGKPTDAARVIFYHDDPSYYYAMWVNPYTGQVLKVRDMDKEFFRVVLMGHYYLWLPPAIGQQVVLISTLVFLAMMITGLILWWPRNKAARKQRFSVKWNAAWRRKNYDLHNVLGFYMTWVVIFMAITGLVFGYQWLANGIYKVAGGNKTLQYTEPLSDSTKTGLLTLNNAVDRLYVQMKQEHAGAETIEVHFPDTKTAAIEIAANTDASTYWRTDYRFFDQNTMQEIPVKHIYGRFKDAKAADKLLRMNYDIHVGAIGGIAGKVLVFFASLIAASLPVTGFIIWWGRKNRKKTAMKKKVAAAPAAVLAGT